VLTIRIPAEGWKPAGFVPKAGGKLVSSKHVTASQAVKTPQFYLLFWILCLNVTAGIGVLGQASVMIQELFSEQSVGAGAAPEGMGLTGMRARVEALGGTLTVDPRQEPDEYGRVGTVVEARMPL